MGIEITGRHLEIGDSVKDYAREKAERIAAEFPRVEHVHIILDREKGYRNTAEVVLQAKDHIRVEAAETADDLYAAIDVATEKVERQLRKHRDKVLHHKAKSRFAALERGAGAPGNAP